MTSHQEISSDFKKIRKDIFQSEKSNVQMVVNFIVETGRILRKKGRSNDFQLLADRSIEILDCNFFLQKSLLLRFVALGEEEPLGADMLKYYIAIEKYLDNSLNDQTFKIRAFLKIGESYQSSSDYTKALVYLLRAKNLAHYLKNGFLEVSCCIRLGNVYSDSQEFKKAIEYFQKALENSNAMGILSGIACICCNLGNAYLVVGEYTKAIEVLQKGLENSIATGNQSETASINSNLGNAYRNLGEHKKAIMCYQKGLEISNAVGDRVGVSRNKCNLGNAYVCLGKYEQAIVCYEEALEISIETGDRSAIVKDKCNLGNVYFNLGEIEKAILYFKECLEISTAIGDQIEIASANANLGNVNFSLGDYTEAIKYYQTSLKVHTAIGDQSGIAGSTNNLGSAYLRLGEFRKAAEYCQKALEINTAIGDRSGVATSNVSLGNAYLRLGEYEKAINFYQKGLDISTEIGNLSEMASGNVSLGNAYLYLGEYEKTIQYYQKGLKIFVTIGNQSGIASTNGNLGNVYSFLGEYEKAIDYCKKTIEISIKIGDPSIRANSIGSVASVYLNLGMCEKAIVWCQKGLEITRAIGDRSAIIHSNANLGDAYFRLGEYKNAIDCYQESLTMSTEIEEQLGIARNNRKLGNAYFALREWDKAMNYYQKGLEVSSAMNHRPEVARINANLGTIHISLLEYEKAIAHFSQGLSISVEMRVSGLEGYCLGGIGHSYMLQGLRCSDKQKASYLFEQASFHLRRSLLCWDQTFSGLAIDQNKISFTKEYFATYVRLMRCFLLLDRIEAAMLVIDLGKAKALHDFIEEKKSEKEMLDYVRKTWETISDQKEQVQIKEICKTLESYDGKFSVLLFAFDGENCLNIWVLTGEGEIQTFKQSDQFSEEVIFNKLETLFEISNLDVLLSRDASFQNVSASSSPIREMVSLLHFDSKQATESRARPAQLGNYENAENENSNNSSETVENILQTLYEMIIHPVKDVIKTGKLIIVPDKFLFFLPFCSLLDANGRRLSDEYSVQITPSLHTLVSCMTKSRDQSLGFALFVGNPNLRNLNFRGIFPEPLPNAAREVELLAPLFEAKTLLEDEATKENVLDFIHDASILHIAAHGEPDKGEILLALRSNEIAQSSSLRENSYLLKQQDIIKIKLKARLVVLSCCHTGQGSVSSEGVVGLTRAFLAAGAQSVLATLWPIHDAATKEFMQKFYQEVCDETLVCEALRRTMNTFQKHENQEFQKFKFWAPFTIYGEDVKFSQSDIEEIKQRSRELSNLSEKSA